MHKIFGLISILNFNVVHSRTITFKNLLQFMSGEGTRNDQMVVILKRLWNTLRETKNQIFLVLQKMFKIKSVSCCNSGPRN